MTVAVLCADGSILRGDAGPKTIVTAPRASVHDRPDVTARVMVTVRIGDVVQVRRQDGAWCDVSVPAAGSLRGVDGWIQTADIAQSPGMARFWAHDVRGAALALDAESRAATDPTVAAWLRMFLGYSQWAIGQLDQARATFNLIAHRQPPARFSAEAFVAAARLAAIQGDVTASLASYQELLAALPRYRAIAFEYDSAADPYPMGWDRESELTQGAPHIPQRIEALRQLIAAQVAAARITGSAATTPLQKATAWHSLGRAWQDKNDVEPGETMLRGMIAGNTDARAHFTAAIAAAPGSDPAARSAWQLIDLSQPYEWEGDWQAQADWMLEKYGQFVADYPRHELTPAARFKVAEATWAKGGFPEVFHYVFDPAGGAAIRKREAVLDQWFDMRGPGGRGTLPLATPHPEEAVKAQQMFQTIVADSPASSSAAMAQYYVAVIFDYCLGQPAKALPEYEAFLRRYPDIDPFAEKARRRIAAIRGR